MTISVRLDPQTQAVLDRLARARGISRSQVVRESLAGVAAAAGGADAERPRTPYERAKHLLGCFSGPADLARRAEARLASVIGERHRARRSR